MRAVKSKAKQYELAQAGLLFYVDNGRYAKANVGVVISMHGKMTFYARVRRETEDAKD